MEKAYELVEEGKNIMISGFGGSGKTKMLRDCPLLSDADYCGTTGMSAVALMNGENHPMTIHSFFGIGLGEGSKEDCYKYTIRQPVKGNKYIRKHKVIARILKCKILVIDEASMLSAETLDKIEFIARMIKSSWRYNILFDNKIICHQIKTTCNKFYDETKTKEDDEKTKLERLEEGLSEDEDIYVEMKSFGGIQLVFSADLLQLRPVKENWIFKAECFQLLNFNFVKFDKPYRHTDIDYYYMLGRIRDGTFTKDDINKLKERIISEDDIKNYEINGIKPTILFCKRVDVDAFNHKELAKLKGEIFTFKAEDTDKKYSSYFDEAIPKEINLKVGSQVMLKVNIDVEQGLINGARGVIMSVDKDGCKVQFLKVQTFIEREKYWFVKDQETKKYVYRNQIPLVLCYSMTIHKSQGLTIDHLICDLSECFTSGMCYVALSRCRTLNDLHLLSFDKSKIKVSKMAFDFLKERDLL